MAVNTRATLALITGGPLSVTRPFGIAWALGLMVLCWRLGLGAGHCAMQGLEVHCTCDPKVAEEAGGLLLTFNAFEHVSRVTVTDCHNVTFVGNAYLPYPPSVIRFLNVPFVNHQLEGQRWSSADVEGGVVRPIQRIEFVNVTKIFQLHLNELFPVNRVELLLLRNVTEVLKMECLPDAPGQPDIVPSRITEVRIENTRIMNLKPYSFNLVDNRKFLIRDSFIFTWSSQAIDVGQDNRLFSVVNSVVSKLQAHPITGSVLEEAEVTRSRIGTAEDHAFSAFRFTKTLRMTHNEVRNATTKTFEGLFRFTHNRSVDFSANALPCPLHAASGRLCLLNLGPNTRVVNNTCYSMDHTHPNKRFDHYYDIRCQSASTSSQLSPSYLLLMVSIGLILHIKT